MKQIGSVTLVRRLGWLADHAGAEIPERIRTQMHRMADRPGVSFVGPRKGAKDAIGYTRQWHLMVNIPMSAISESRARAKRHKIEKQGA